MDKDGQDNAREISGMTSPAFQAEIESRSSQCVLVAELYPETALPTVDGFDPHDSIACLSSVGGIEYQDQTYLREVSKFGDISHTDSGKFSNGSLTISNIDQWIAAFEFTYGIEGLFYVLRLISRTSVDLDDSYVLFTGRCDKAGDANKKELPITAKELLGSVDTQAPPRNFSHIDEEGRRANDPYFEAFRFVPKQFTINYQSSEPRGGILGSLLGLRRTVTKTLQASSHSALDINKPLPIVLGRAQLSSQHIGYGDYGNSITMLTAWADGLSYGIRGFKNLRNVDAGFTAIQVTVLTPQYRFGLLAKTGTGTGINVPMGTAEQVPLTWGGGGPDPWPGNGYYSRTAWTGCFVDGSELENDDAAPQLLCIVYGNMMPTCVELDDWSEIAFSDNAIDHARFVATDPYLLKMPSAFIDDEHNFIERQFCDEILVDEVNTDTVILPPAESGKAGTDYQHFQSTGVVSADWYRWLNGENVNPHEQEAEYVFEVPPPIENGGGTGDIDPTNPDGTILTKYRRRYTSNLALTEVSKAIDVLTNMVYPSARIFHTYSPAGRLRFHVKRPADNTLIRSDISIGATEVPVYSIYPWLDNLTGQVLVGSDTDNDQSELRVVASVRYTSVANSITLTASGGITASGATFTGGDNSTNPAIASLTLTDITATKTIVIDGVTVIVVSSAPNGVNDFAGLVKDAINSHSILSLYIKASWTPGTAVVNLESTLGFLVLESALEFAHDGPIASPTTAPAAHDTSGGHLAAGDWSVAYSYELDTGETRISSLQTVTVAANGQIDVSAITPPAGVSIVNWFLSREESSTTLKFILSNDGSIFSITDPPLQTARFAPQVNDTGEECTRMDFVFSDRPLTRSNATRANILADSFKWPLGGRQSSVNQVIAKYREAVEDFRPTELRINDSRHQAKVGKKLPYELNLAGVDNYHQAARLSNGKLAELRDADSFASWSAGQESLLTAQVGKVGCVSDFGSGLVNYMVRLEDVGYSWKGILSLNLVGRKYSKSLYDDDVSEKYIPLPTTLVLPRLTTEARAEVVVTGGSYTLTITEANAGAIEFTGTLVSNATVLFPDNIVRRWKLLDSTVRGGFTFTVDTVTTGAPVTISPGDNSISQNGIELIMD